MARRHRQHSGRVRYSRGADHASHLVIDASRVTGSASASRNLRLVAPDVWILSPPCGH